MTKTGKQIEQDLWMMLSDSILGLSITGKVYRKGQRPRDSKLEDAVVIFTSGSTSQIQNGVVTINIYVPDKDFYGNGQLLEDGNRTSELEERAQRWVDGLTCDLSNYKFKLRQTITTDNEPEIHQHFVVVILEYDYYADDTDENPIICTEDGDEINIFPMQLKTEQPHAVEVRTTEV